MKRTTAGRARWQEAQDPPTTERRKDEVATIKRTTHEQITGSIELYEKYGLREENRREKERKG